MCGVSLSVCRSHGLDQGFRIPLKASRYRQMRKTNKIEMTAAIGRPLGSIKNVNEINVHNYGSEQNQTERDETSDKQEQAANYLEHGDDVKIVAQKKSLREVSE